MGIGTEEANRLGTTDYLTLAGIAVVLVALVSGSLLYYSGPGSVPLLWPGNGFALAALLACRPALRFPILAVAFSAYVLANAIHIRQPVPALGFAIVNTLEIAVASRLVGWIAGGPRFLESIQGTFQFFTLVCLASAGLSAIPGGLVALVSYGGEYPRHFFTWFMADAAGLAVVTPALLAWTQPHPPWIRRTRQSLEFAACMVFSLLITYIVFARPERLWAAAGHPMAYAVFPCLAWAALRFGVRGVTAASLGVQVISAWYTSRGLGPFAADSSSETIAYLAVHTFPYTIAFCSLAPAILLGSHLRTEDRLRLRDSRFGSLWNSKLIGIYVTDLGGNILEANETFLAMVKRTHADLEAGRIEMLKMATPEYQARAKENREKFRREGQIGPFERDWILDDGQVLPSLVYASMMEGRDRALGMVMDIGELRKTQEELRTMASRFRNMFDSNIIGVAVVNQERVFEEANDAFLALTGYDRGDLEAGGIRVEMLYAPGMESWIAATEASIRSRGKMEPLETVFRRKDGGLTPVYRGVARLEGTEKLLAVAIDLSELKRTQAALEAAKSEAEAANEAKSDFLAMMSHEIRTPLNGIMGMISLLSETPLNAEQQGFARVMRESGDHLMALINQVLDFSKIKSGHLQLDSSPFRMSALVEGSLAAITEMARRKGLVLVTRIDPELPDRFVGDPVRLQQVLLNLIGNAVKFSDRGEVALAIRLAERRGRECRVLFEISDQGPGLAPETLSRLFRPFIQGDESLSRRVGGTGLGLVISQDLVGKMGGEITVESEPGKGSRFRFTIGLLSQEEAFEPDGHPGSGQEAAWKSPPRILVVDDHPVNLIVATSMLTKLGCMVETASDGATALSTALRRPYDLILMDCQMPVMDGFETTRKLRASEKAGEHLPVVALTAHAVSGFREKCLEQGMDDYISKPFTVEDLSRIVRRWTGIGSGAQPGSSAGPAPDTQPEAQGAPPSGGEPEPVDWKRLDGLRDSTPDGGRMVQGLIKLFLDTTRSALDDIRREFQEARPRELAMSIHKLKGSCRTLGARRMAARLEFLEKEIGTGGAVRLPSLLEQLEADFASTRERLMVYESMVGMSQTG